MGRTAFRPYDETLLRMYERSSLDLLPRHLQTTYDIDVAGVVALDVGVMRVDRRDGNPWVARVFSSRRLRGSAACDAAVLSFLAAAGYEAERLAHPEPLSVLDGQEVLVTEFVPSRKRKIEPDVLTRMGRLLGRLHALPSPAAGNSGLAPAGALHHFADGTRTDEMAAARSWLDQFESDRIAGSDRKHLDTIRAALDEADDGEGLPMAVIHPDPVGKNMVRTADDFMYVDWTGAGVGPRAVSLAWALGSKSSAAGVVAGYREYVEPTDEEWERLRGVLLGRKVIDLCFGLGLQPASIAKKATSISRLRREARQVVDAARPPA